MENTLLKQINSIIIRIAFILFPTIITTYSRAQNVNTLIITGDEIRNQIFRKTPLAQDYHFSFNYQFSEFKLHTADDKTLYYLLFPATKAKGVVLYLHGSIGAANVWGEIAPIYTKIGYDFCLLDYRGYGKSGGTVTNQEQLYDDV
jgi:hypothetical protein